MLIFALALAFARTDWPNISELRPLSAGEVRERVVGHSTHCPGDVSLSRTYAFGDDGKVTISGDPGALVTRYKIEDGGIAYYNGEERPMQHVAFYADKSGKVYQAWGDGRAIPICLISLRQR
jgi:hypothetical protein